MLTIYGIPNCDKCRAAVKWFAARGIRYRFHDLRADGITANLLEQWQKAASDDVLINKRSQTWRKIPEPDREGLDRRGNLELMLAHPTLIKRPLVTAGSAITVGYDEAGWTNTFLHGI